MTEYVIPATPGWYIWEYDFDEVTNNDIDFSRHESHVIIAWRFVLDNQVAVRGDLQPVTYNRRFCGLNASKTWYIQRPDDCCQFASCIFESQADIVEWLKDYEFKRQTGVERPGA